MIAESPNAMDHPQSPQRRWRRFSWILGIVGLLFFVVMLLFPLVFPPSRILTPEQVCARNGIDLFHAITTYRIEHGTYPPAYIADENGKPMHSWRVLILPYLSEQTLYDRYRFDEPWDGPNNRKLLSSMPRIFRCPSYGHVEHQSKGDYVTNYLLITGDETIFPGSKATKHSEVTDPLHGTLLLVDVNYRSVDWMQPTDLSAEEFATTFQDKDSSNHSGGTTCTFAAGNARFISNSISPETLRALTTKAGGEAIADDE